jgi:hypothetical protein
MYEHIADNHENLLYDQYPNPDADIARLESIRLVPMGRPSLSTINTCHVHTLARPMDAMYITRRELRMQTFFFHFHSPQKHRNSP